MAYQEFVRLGKILKTSGLKGGLAMTFDYDLPYEKFLNDFLFIDIEHELIPFCVISVEKQGQNRCAVLLEDIENFDEAKKLCGRDIYLPLEHELHQKVIKKQNTQISGYEVIDIKKGKIGIVEKLIDLPKHKIIQVFWNKKEILIPFNPNIVKKIDKKKKCIFVESPEGLIDFYIK